MDVQTLALGFGFGGAAGAILSEFIGMAHLSVAFFFMGGILGAIVCGAEGINPMEELFGGLSSL